MKNFYYHVTPVDNLSSIIEKGLMTKRGRPLFVFNNKKASSSIAKNQCGLKDYALFRIDPKGITSLKPDNVGELTAKYQFIVEDSIPSKYLKFINCYTVI